jgi:hypothetical protein
MRIFDSIERPILFATSRAMSWVYRTASIAPGRQVAYWEMFVASVEISLVLYVFHFLYHLGEQMLVYILPVMALSKVLDVFMSYRRLKRIRTEYDARAYREACTSAEMHRLDRGTIRLLALLLVVGAFLTFSMARQTSYNWVGLTVAAYFTLYASIFYVRACEPPQPNEGDFFALPQGGRA